MKGTLKYFILSLMISNVHADLITFSPGNNVKSEEINNNFEYILNIIKNNNNLTSDYQGEFSFNKFSQGEVISKEIINENISKMIDLGASASLLNNISAEEFNIVFEQLEREAIKNYKSPCSGATENRVVSGTQDLVGGQVYKFNNLTINAGSTLRITGNSGGWTEICVLNNLVNNGTILARAGYDGQQTHSSGSFTKESELGIGLVEYSIIQKNGGNGGAGTYGGAGGVQVDGIGGGGGGGGANNAASTGKPGAPGTLGNGGNATGTWDSCSTSGGRPGSGGGGAGGEGQCPGRRRSAGGGGGGYKGHHGKGLIIYVENQISGNGAYNVSGRNGFNGGSYGWATDSGTYPGGYGGGGAGGSAGKVIIKYSTLINQPNVVVNGGLKGSGNGSTENGDNGSFELSKILK